jgi:hypothetical protein
MIQQTYSEQLAEFNKAQSGVSSSLSSLLVTVEAYQLKPEFLEITG